jgi:hypothetical protein
MSLAATESPFPIPRGLALALAAIGPVAIGGILAAKAGDPTPLAAVPTIAFGVLAATSPALYIAMAALGDAPPAGRVARALVIGLGAFGIALAGLVMPAAFLSLSSISQETTLVMTSLALAGAAWLGVRRLARELAMRSPAASVIFVVWAFATLGIAARLWLDLGLEVMS